MSLEGAGGTAGAGSPLIAALKGRTSLQFKPSPTDTTFSASQKAPLVPSSPLQSPEASSFALTSTWEQRFPSSSTSKSERFQPPERSESQKYDAWKDIFQRTGHFDQNLLGSHQDHARSSRTATTAIDDPKSKDGDDEYYEDEYYYEYYYDDEAEAEEKKDDRGRVKAKNGNIEVEFYYEEVGGGNRANHLDGRKKKESRRPPGNGVGGGGHKTKSRESERRWRGGGEGQQRKSPRRPGPPLPPRRRRQHEYPVLSRRDDTDYDYVRRDDRGSAEDLANKDYSVDRNRKRDRGMTARIADAVFTPTFGLIFAAVGIPTVLAGGYYLLSEHGPTPVVQARRQSMLGEDGEGEPGSGDFEVILALTKALFEAVRGEAQKLLEMKMK